MHLWGPRFLLDCLSIILIDLLLAGDNALVIALVVRDLPPRRRRAAIGWGAALAVALRVTITFVAAQLLRVEFVQLAGGALVIWIAVRVLVDAGPRTSGTRHPARLLEAVCWIVLADLTMSTDNVLAIAGASHGSLALIVLGLSVSIPLVVFSSTLLVVLMNRYPVIVYAGAAVLGSVGGEMMITDSSIVRHLDPSNVERYAVRAFFALAVVAAGRMLQGGAAESSEP